MDAAWVPVDRLVLRRNSSPLGPPSELAPAGLQLDQLARPLADLRLSVTDRCNFRCGYCMPRSKVGPVAAPTSRQQLLNFDEIEQIAASFVDLGVNKLRITGGEPLVRRDLPHLIERLSGLAIRDLCMTTNGSLLANQAAALAASGLQRVTVSLDAIDDLTFRRITDGHTPLRQVLAGIDAARRHGLGPVKINMVVQRGINEHSIIPMAAWARREGLELRYIEFMDVGCSNGWRADAVLTAAEIREAIHREWPISPVETKHASDTSEQFRYSDGRGQIGIIAAVSRPFCGSCTRARVSSTGSFYPCLFAPAGVDLAGPLRSGAALRPIIAELWQRRADRYSELRSSMPKHLPRPEMSAIGG